MHVHDCIFCKVIHRELPSKIVRETDGLLAFFDVNPMAPTHILVVPKEHISSANELKPAHRSLIGDMVLFAKELAQEQKIHESGFRLVMNTGSGAGQSVFHIHLHLLGGRAMGWPPG